MYRFFVEANQIAEDEIIIIGTDVNHIKNVLRMVVGDKLMVSGQDDKEYTCYIKDFAGDEIVLSVVNVEEVDVELKSKIYLFQGLPKGDKMELIVQKAVELGAFEIIPVAMKNCVVKLDKKKAESKVKRWQGIATSAAKQAKRMIIPKVTAPMSFAEAITYAEALDVKLMPYEKAVDMKATMTFLNEIESGQLIGVFIGPEGGFDQTEVTLAEQSGIKPITLGKRILRTETAGITTLSILMFLISQKT